MLNGPCPNCAVPVPCRATHLAIYRWGYARGRTDGRRGKNVEAGSGRWRSASWEGGTAAAGASGEVRVFYCSRFSFFFPGFAGGSAQFFMLPARGKEYGLVGVGAGGIVRAPWTVMRTAERRSRGRKSPRKNRTGGMCDAPMPIAFGPRTNRQTGHPHPHHLHLARVQRPDLGGVGDADG
jgi:hypothetical protein